MRLLEFFHLIHVVDDEDEVDAFYDRLFQPQRFAPKHFSDNEKRWASLSMVSDLMLEVIEPSGEEADLRMPLSRFRTRFGQHFHSLAWYVDPSDVRSVFDGLRAAGIRVARPGGGMMPEDAGDVGNTLFSHPKDTFGQIEFEGKRDYWEERDPRFQPGWTTAPWREGPLGIEKLSHMTTVVRDRSRAVALYRDVLGAMVFHEAEEAGARRAFALVGTDTVIELAEPVSEGSLMARDLAANGEINHSATFRVRDLDRAEEHVARLGIGVLDRGGHSLTLDPDDCFGAVWCFTDRDLPGDPRSPQA
ncbi:MAG TPA: VOC family protein [Acidimicrobiales bacterium]|nr:VOC family protein [Acidimicrobiales bacterium]